jgi:hypothetical protein
MAVTAKRPLVVRRIASSFECLPLKRHLGVVGFGDAVSALPGPLPLVIPLVGAGPSSRSSFFLTISVKYSRRPSGLLG